MSINQNKEAVGSALAAVKSHVMCALFEDLGGCYRVLYPCGFRLDGVQAVYAHCGKAVALGRLLDVMERHWKEDL